MTPRQWEFRLKSEKGLRHKAFFKLKARRIRAVQVRFKEDRDRPGCNSKRPRIPAPLWSLPTPSAEGGLGGGGGTCALGVMAGNPGPALCHPLANRGPDEKSFGSFIY